MYVVNALVDALKRNKIEEAKQLFDQGEKLPKDLSDFDKGQVYDALVRNRAFGIIKSLVKNGIIETDIYEYEKFEGTIFVKLFQNLTNEAEDLTFLRDFLSTLDNINDSLQDKTLLEVAFVNSVPLEIIKLLVEAGCDVNYKSNYEENFLYKIVEEYGIKEGTGLKYLDFLIQEGLDLNAGNIVRDTPLHLAISKNKKQYIEFLLQNGADPNLQGKDGDTAFFTAVVHQVCNVEMYNMLKEYAPADFDLVNKQGETLLLGAVRMRIGSSESELRLLQALIEDGADVYQTSPYYEKSKSALDWISERPSDVLEMVLNAGVIDIGNRDEEGNTLLHTVCAYNVNYDHEAAKQIYRKVKLLIEHGADVNCLNDLDKTPMDLAAQDNLKNKTVELLLKNKV